MNIAASYEKWLNSSRVSDADKEILRGLSEEEKEDAFFKDIEFGTAGMRGILGPGTNRMNEFTVRKATVAFGLYLLNAFPDARSRGVAISHDNRHQSREFTLQAADILNSMGIKAYIFDSLRPTPELSYAVRYEKACGGIMVTASHNPKEYNGYKVYDENGCQLVPEKIEPLLKIMAKLPDYLQVEIPTSLPRGETVLLPKKVDDDYVKAVEAIQLNPDLDKTGFKIVYTPQHGASYENAMRVFSDCGYRIYPVAIQCTHDPDFGGTLSPNPENDDAYIEPIKLAQKEKADLIVMTDPDGDRVGVAYRDNNGDYKRLTGNESGALLIQYVLQERKKKGLLPKNGVLYDTIVTSSLGADIARSYGVKVESFLTGFKFIGDRIAHYEGVKGAPEFVFGYEESYGCLLAPFVRDKDGIQAILLYCEMALYHHLQGENLGEAFVDLQKQYGFHDTVCNSVYFEGPSGAQDMKKIMDELHEKPLKEIGGLPVVEVQDYEKSLQIKDGRTSPIELPKSEVVKFFLADHSTVCVRPSGTEPKCKFYVETVSSAPSGLKEKTEHLYQAICQDLGVKA